MTGSIEHGRDAAGASNPWRTALPWCLAHRGAAGEALENTLAAFAHGKAAGADMLEFDARLSADGQAVVSHDPTLARTHGVDVAVAEHTARELAAYDVPTVAEALAACDPLPVTLELKVGEPLGSLIAQLISDAGYADRIIVAGRRADALQAVRQRLPATATSLAEDEPELQATVVAALSGEEGPPLPPQVRALQLPVAWQGVELAVEPVIARAHALDLAFHVWTVNEPDALHAMLDRGVDGIVTDHPSRLRRIIDERAQG